MIINKTADYTYYRNPVHFENDRTPKFLRRSHSASPEGDILEISEIARTSHFNRTATPLMRAGSRISPEIGALIALSEQREDSQRRISFDAVRDAVRNGSYDFDDNAKLKVIAEGLSPLLGLRR